jgi:hypothetical protein
MSDIPVLGRDDHRSLVNQFLSQYDVPAYVRRAREVQNAFEQLTERCRRRRDEWLSLVRVRLGLLHGLASDWAALRPLLADDEQVEILRRLHAALEPRPRVWPEPTSSPRVLRRALADLRESLERFNRRWRELLPTVDLTRVNELREGYNRYYLLEKECAVRSARLARQGFQRLDPLTTDDLAGLLPPLPVPRLRA